MMCGEACPADACEMVSAMFGSWSDQPRSGTASSGIVLLTFLRVQCSSIMIYCDLQPSLLELTVQAWFC